MPDEGSEAHTDERAHRREQGGRRDGAEYTGILLLLPFLLNGRHRWSSAILHALPHSAWERLVQLGEPFESAPYPATIGGSWIVYAAWPLAAAVIATAAVRRRDL
ncbi:hypothetical protein OHS70_05870 [Streptomyces sp. NBC_00390]|uniref:hypothetical protein n=1 Tax=Streptomyces sp. NBC_00390 TaxID=2975736 RepID=UPI002E200157